MTVGSTAALTVIFFVTSLVTVVTGSTSLITVPVLMQFGLATRTAVATNMLALSMLSLGGLLSFAGTPAVDRQRTPLLAGLTVVGSACGALLLFAVPSKWMSLVIPVAMLAVLALLLVYPPGDGLLTDSAVSPRRTRLGYLVMTLLSLYGGFLSGGYATLVTVAGIVFFRYAMLRAIAMSRLLNTASSLVAVMVFAWKGAIDWRLGLILSVVNFAGGWLGLRWARKLPELWLRRGFVTAVAGLAVKSLVFDVPWRELFVR